MFKLIPLLCTHVYSYMFSTVHPPEEIFEYSNDDYINLSKFEEKLDYVVQVVDIFEGPSKNENHTYFNLNTIGV